MLLNIFLALPNIFLMPLSSLDISLMASLSPWQFLGDLIVHQHFLSVPILPKTLKKTPLKFFPTLFGVPWCFSMLQGTHTLPWCLHGVPWSPTLCFDISQCFPNIARCPLMFPNIPLLLENNSWCPLTFSQCSTASSISFMSLSMSLVLLASLLCLEAWWKLTNVKQMSKSKLLVTPYLGHPFKS